MDHFPWAPRFRLNSHFRRQTRSSSIEGNFPIPPALLGRTSPWQVDGMDRVAGFGDNACCGWAEIAPSAMVGD
jgi:hypothetical protein